MGKKSNSQQPPTNTPFGIKGYSHTVPKSTPPPEFYENYAGSEKHILDLVKFLFDEEQWCRNFNEIFARVPKKRQIMRMMVQAGTIDSCNRGSYYLKDGTLVRLDKRVLERSAAATKLYPNDFSFLNKLEKRQKDTKPTKSQEKSKEIVSMEEPTEPTQPTMPTESPDESTLSEIRTLTINETPIERPQTTTNETPSDSTPQADSPNTTTEATTESESDMDSTEENESTDETTETTPIDISNYIKNDKIMVFQGDCIEAGLWLKHYFNTNPIILNMASASHPGGGYRSGAGAQEESLHRRTNLFQCLEDPYNAQKRDWSYPIPEFGGIYSPDVYVLRESEAKGYAFKSSPETISFVSVAAYSNPPVETTGERTVLSKKIATLTAKKIDTIFNIAMHNGHDCIVLGAFGCGAYSNPAAHIAQLFHKAIQQYQSHFRMIAFAIIDAKSDMNPKGNLFYFTEEFQCNALNVTLL